MTELALDAYTLARRELEAALLTARSLQAAASAALGG
jgi:hypothetical protein